MKGLPPTLDLSPLVGAQVSQICFGAFQCIFNFDVAVRIAVESTCIYTGPSGAVTSVRSFPQAAAELCELIGISVQGAFRENSGGLLLQFMNGATLRVLNDNKEYESFQIHVSNTVYVA